MQRKKISIVRPLGRSKHKDSLGDSFLHILGESLQWKIQIALHF